jgi:pimeloyl-ACP methyl ester carboxylesterase
VWAKYQRLAADGAARRADQALDELVLELRRDLQMLLGHVVVFGFSGGGQFAHRYVMANPHRVASAVVAAPGWYTFPDREQPYPYGSRIGGRLDGVRMEPEGFLRVPILVVVGEDDDDPRAENLRRSQKLDLQQGVSRVERADRWVRAMREEAISLGTPPRVRLVTLPGAGHSFADCMKRGLDELVLEQFRALAAPPFHGRGQPAQAAPSPSLSVQELNT